ncbi:CidA/LrgA family protein [Nocardioidaceae bacterium]|nr:CidA/LrgA family protein [Nocardioidaceae bacterium]
MILGLLGLLACQLVGEVLVAVTGLPVPGPVVGLVVLLAWLTWRRPGADHPVVRTGDGLLRHLQLLFVPAGVGVVAQAAVIGGSVAAIAAGLVVSWFAGLAVTGGVAVLLLRLTTAREGSP